MQHIPQWEKKMYTSYIVGLIPVHLFISSHWRPLLLMLQSWRLLVNVSVLKKSLVKLRSAGQAQTKFFLSSMEACGAPGWIFLHPTVKTYQLEKQMRVHITLVTELFPLTNLTKLSTEEASGGAHIWSHPFFFVSKHQSREWHQTADPQKKTCVIIIRQSSPEIIHVWLGGLKHIKVTRGCIIHGRVFPPLFTMRRAERAARVAQPYSHDGRHLHTGPSRVIAAAAKKKNLHSWWLPSQFARLSSLCSANLRQHAEE